MDSLTSGFNIVTELVRWDAFNEIMSFTEEEEMFALKNKSLNTESGK